MPGEDIDLKILIKALLDSKGFEDAQAQLKALGSAAKDKAAPGLADLASKQEVSKREIRLLSAELLRSIGMTQGAGVAGRLAAESYVALGDAANYANVALTAGAVLIVSIIPKIVEWIAHSKEATEEQKKIQTAIEAEIPLLADYLDKLRLINPQLAEMAAHFQTDALRKEADERVAINAQMETQARSLERHKYLYQNYNTLLIAHGESLRAEVGSRDELKRKIEDEESAYTKLYDRSILLQKAQQGELTVEQYLTLVHKTNTKSIEDEAAADKERDAEKMRIFDRKAAYDKAAAEHENEMLNFSADLKQADKERGDMALATAKKVEAAKLQEMKAEGKQILAEAKDAVQRKKLHDEEILRKKQEAAQTQETYISAITTLVSAFTKNKTINVAAAIADTYAAADRAFWMAGGYPWGIAPMLATIAQGLANVKRIESAGAGFDDPFADLVAAKMGRKSAEDFAKHFGGQFSAALPGAMAAATTNNYTTINQGGMTLNNQYHSIIGARKTEQLKQLKHDLVIIDRMYNRGRIGG